MAKKQVKKQTESENKSESELIIYQPESGDPRVTVRLEGETAWMSQKELAELFGNTKQNIGQHIKNILEEGELDQNAVVKKIFTTANDGKQYHTEHYNLDMIISLGYRVNSKVATNFRICRKGVRYFF